MSKAKDYIEAYTKRCGNDEVTHTTEAVIITFHPWLTPENALAAVEIERQEVIEKAVKWLSTNFYLSKNFISETSVLPVPKYLHNATKEQFLNEFKQAMEKGE